MADRREIIHQIEYRWHPMRDLSAVASTLSPESLRGWDASIRGWVRHPHADRLWESVCYQPLPHGRAAIAWRYEDLQAAEREDRRKGRPLVSRVLAGQADLLTPEVAITLCRTGLPRSAGPRPGQVPPEAELPVLAAGELIARASEQTPGLDEEAARQQGLRQVVGVALDHPADPLAVYIRDTYIFKPPGEGVQCPLLWGLRRIVRPLLGTAGRDWSFSTFEQPLGDVDPRTLPDILFRQAQDTPPVPPIVARREVKVRPFDETLDDGSPYAELAGWLVAEYQERGGDELRRRITEWCGTEQLVSERLALVKDQLRPRRSPYQVPVSGSKWIRPLSPLTPESTPESRPSPVHGGGHLPSDEATVKATTVPESAGIFISYRRQDAPSAASWLFDLLTDRFGSRVFKDVDSIRPGDDFVEEVTAAVESCAVLLAVIGRQWLAVANEVGERRLDDPADFVRLEIEAALTRDIRVIPILVEGARMPRAADLPSSLQKLARRQALEVNPLHFRLDVGRIFRVLDETLASETRSRGHPG